jgi:hypothetical protein
VICVTIWLFSVAYIGKSGSFVDDVIYRCDLEKSQNRVLLCVYEQCHNVISIPWTVLYKKWCATTSYITAVSGKNRETIIYRVAFKIALSMARNSNFRPTEKRTKNYFHGAKFKFQTHGKTNKKLFPWREIQISNPRKTAQKITFSGAKFKFKNHGNWPPTGFIHPWKKITEIWPFSVFFLAAILAPGDCARSRGEA